MNRTLTKVLLPLAILGLAAASAAFMMAHRITPDRLQAEERVEPVEVQEITHSTEEVVVRAQGTVTAAQKVELRPEVSGRILSLSPALVPGGFFRAGEVIATIDPRDYEVQLKAQRQVLAQTRLALEQERAQQAVAEQEWELLEGSIPAVQSNRDLVLRIPQIEQAEAAVVAAEGAVAKAELDLERCTIIAPFNAVVQREEVDLGQLVTPQSTVATLVGTDAYWIQVSLPVEELSWIEIPRNGGRGGAEATIVHRVGNVGIEREGRVERLLADVDPAGRLARLLVVIDDPLGRLGAGASSELPLLLGSYVTVHIRGRRIENAIVIPRRALREVQVDGFEGAREGLWLMDGDDRLAIRQAEVLRRSEDSVIVANGLADGERLIISNIGTPIAGMKLSVADSSPVSER